MNLIIKVEIHGPSKSINLTSMIKTYAPSFSFCMKLLMIILMIHLI